MKKFMITVIAAIVCASASFANTTPQQRLDIAKAKFEAMKSAYENVATNSTSKAEIANAKKAYKDAESAFEDAQDELELLKKWNLHDFTDSQLADAQWQRYTLGKPLQISRWFTSRDEAFNVTQTRAAKAQKDPVKKAQVTWQIIEDL